MTWIMNPVLFLIVISSPTLSYGQEELNVKVVNPGGASSGDTLHLVYGQEEVVICQITNADKIPDVNFGFVRNAEFPITESDVKTNSEVTGNKYNVNVTLTFQVTGEMNREYLSCSFDGQEWKAYLQLYFPPLLSFRGYGRVPNSTVNKVEMFCETISFPETQLEWKVGGIPLSETDFTHTTEQGCKQVWNTNFESASNKYQCRTNLTLLDLGKEDIGTEVTCTSTYQGVTVSGGVVRTLDYIYNSDNITVVAKPTQIVKGSVNGTMELTCTTAPSNPEPYRLEWYRGSSQYYNMINMSQYPVSIEDTGMYKGRIATQTVNLSVNKELHGETYLCCVNDLIDYIKLICGSTVLQVRWLSEILAPSFDKYTVYVGSDLSIPCSVDSNPVAVVSWLNKDGQTIAEGSNYLELSIVTAKKIDSGEYECRASLNTGGSSNLLHEVSKMINVDVVDVPDKPLVNLVDQRGHAPDIEIITASTAPAVPQAFYIQFKKSSDSVWIEISKAFSDTLPGQTSEQYKFSMFSLGLQSGDYQVRVKALSQNGAIMYTDAQTFNIKPEEEMVEKSTYNTAIVVSVLVTAAVFIIILVVVVCLLKRGACSSDGKWDVR